VARYKISGVAEQRVWRLRKLHQSVDAELHNHSGSAVELRFLYNGDVAYARVCHNRAEALSEAAAKRAELERDGWMFHW
jgi:hypothetical protein